MLSCICTCTCTCKCKCTYTCFHAFAHVHVHVHANANAHMHARIARRTLLTCMHARRVRTFWHICMRAGTQRDAPGRTYACVPGRSGTQPGRTGTQLDAARRARGKQQQQEEQEEQDICVPPALATPESRLALTQLRVTITSRTRNTISRFGGTDKPVSLPQPPIYMIYCVIALTVCSSVSFVSHFAPSKTSFKVQLCSARCSVFLHEFL